MLWWLAGCVLPEVELETSGLEGDRFDAEGLWIEQAVLRPDGTETIDHVLFLNSYGWGCDRYKTWLAYDPTAIRDLLFANATDLQTECEAVKQGLESQTSADLSWWAGLWMEVPLADGALRDGPVVQTPWLRQVHYSWPALSAQQLECRLANTELGQYPAEDMPEPEDAVRRDFVVEGDLGIDPHPRYVLAEVELTIAEPGGVIGETHGTARFDRCRVERSLD